MGRRFKITNEGLILKFFRFMVTKLPQRNVVFDVNKGRINFKRESRRKGLYISVKDPFLKLENHGYSMQSENKFNKLITRLKEFIVETSKGRIEDLIINTQCEEDAEEVSPTREGIIKSTL